MTNAAMDSGVSTNAAGPVNAHTTAHITHHAAHTV